METTGQKAIHGPLYEKLMSTLPAFVRHGPALDVPALCRAIGMSREGVYKWLRSNKLTADAVKKIVAAAALDENAALLAEAGLPVPTREDFNDFLFA